MSEKKKEPAGMSTAERLEAIGKAKSSEALDAIWTELERVGVAKESVTYAAVLVRREELGMELGEEEKAFVALIEKKRAAGAALPEIRGRLR